MNVLKLPAYSLKTLAKEKLLHVMEYNTVLLNYFMLLNLTLCYLFLIRPDSDFHTISMYRIVH